MKYAPTLPSLICCLVLAASAAYAQRAPVLSAQGSNSLSDAQAELTELFASICLMKFPDAAAAVLYAHAKGMKPMPKERLHAALGNAPGAGWFYDGSFGTYVVTIEDPPDQICAVRKRFGRAPDIKTAMGTLLTLWSGAQHTGTITTLSPREAQASGVRSYAWQLMRSDNGKETFTASVAPGPGQEAEIRLMRALGKN
jgi:hypothetical protein